KRRGNVPPPFLLLLKLRLPTNQRYKLKRRKVYGGILGYSSIRRGTRSTPGREKHDFLQKTRCIILTVSSRRDDIDNHIPRKGTLKRFLTGCGQSRKRQKTINATIICLSWESQSTGDCSGGKYPSHV